VCEEILFRGALLGLLARTVPPVARVLAVALAFGVMHLLLPRILPTAALGVLLGFAAVRSGSLWVPITMHVANNGLLVILGRYGGLDAALTSPPVLLATSAVAITAVAAMRPAARTGARSR
jgi:membrane protease YdiL (CAAX protease family)